MSHHSSNQSLTDTFAKLRELADAPMQDEVHRIEEKKKQLEEALGPTGDYPAGRLVAQDEGGLMFGVTGFNGRVIMDFGKPIQSIGFTRNDALELAKILKAHAKQCPPIIGEPEPIE